MQGKSFASKLSLANACMPTPKLFGGAKNTKDLKNFLRDMELFLALCISLPMSNNYIHVSFKGCKSMMMD